MSTAPFKYEVKRRFSDFMWLRTILIREYSTYYVEQSYKIPPMADKTTQRSFDKEYLEQRALHLQQFMDSLLESEVIRSSIHLLSFLKCADDNQWSKIKEELDKSTKKTSVQTSNQRASLLIFREKLLRERTASRLKILRMFTVI